MNNRYQKLLKIHNSLTKEAGLLKIPQDWYNTAIYSWGLDLVCSNIWYNIEYKLEKLILSNKNFPKDSHQYKHLTKSFIEAHRIIAECKKYTIEPKLQINDVTKIFKVTNEDFPDLKTKFPWKKTLTITIMFPNDYNNDIDQKSSQYQSNKIKIGLPEYLPKTVSDFERIKHNLNGHLTHELQHFIQYLMQDVLYLNQLGGLPSKEMRNLHQTADGRLIGSPAHYKRIDHALQDIEFYPVLSNNVRDFIQKINIIIPEHRQIFLNLWIDNYSSDKEFTENILKLTEFHERWLLPSPFFKQLKRSQPDKYKKAVIELYKEINNLL